MSHLNKLNSVLCSAAVALSVFGTPAIIFAEGEELTTEQTTETTPSTSETGDGKEEKITPQADQTFTVVLMNGSDTVDKIPATVEAGKDSATVVLPKNAPVTDGKIFVGWRNPAADSTTVYEPGESIEINKDTTLMATWKDDTIDYPDESLNTVTEFYKRLSDTITNLISNGDNANLTNLLKTLQSVADNLISEDTGQGVVKSNISTVKDLMKVRNQLKDIEASATNQSTKDTVNELIDNTDQVIRVVLTGAVNLMDSTISSIEQPTDITPEDWAGMMDTIHSELKKVKDAIADKDGTIETIATAFSTAADQIDKASEIVKDDTARTKIAKEADLLRDFAAELNPTTPAPTPTETPDKPTADRVEELLKEKALTIEMKSGTKTYTKSYPLEKDTYTIGNVALRVGTTDTYVCPVKIKTKTYLTQFKKDNNLSKVEADATVTVNLINDSKNDKWIIDGTTPTLVATGEVTANKYVVTLKVGETTWRTIDVDLASGQTSAKTNLPNAEPEKDGYTFVAWKDKKTGTTYKAGQQITVKSDMTLLATWKKGTTSSSPNTAAMNPAGDSAFFATTLTAAAGLGVLAAVKAFRKD